MPRVVGSRAERRVGIATEPVAADVVELQAVSLRSKTSPPGRSTRLTGGFFGPPKSGKTTAACSGSKVLLVEFDPDGDQTETLMARTDVDVYKPESWKDVDDMVKQLLTIDRETWGWWVLDSITLQAEMLGGRELAAAMKGDKDPRRAYQKIGASINQTVRDLLTGPASVIFTAQIKADKADEDDDIVVVGPDEAEYPVTLAVTPMVYKVLGPSVSFIGRTYRRPAGNGQSRFFVSLNDNGRSPASNRLGLPNTIENINLQDLLDEKVKGQA